MFFFPAALLFVASPTLEGTVAPLWEAKPTPIARGVFGHNLEGGEGQGIFGAHPTVGPVTGDGFWDPKAGEPTEEGLRALKEVGATMVRYPGGCLGHGYKWKEMVGPLAQRPGRPFGLMEFMTVCERAGVEPFITAPDYAATPEDIGDLAEFLLAPATPEHPWAMKRAEWGHPAPYPVRHIELGNETEHGNHDLKPFQRWTSGDYVAWCRDSIRRIRKVSRTVKIGAHLGTTFPNASDPWNDVILRELGASVDFLILHVYGVALFEPKNQEQLPLRTLMEACMAQGDQFEDALQVYRTKIKTITGRAIPLAITEYNSLFVQEKPKPLRFSLAGALYAADFLRIIMNPQSGVESAHYWQILNGYFGMVDSRGLEAPRSQAALPFFRLWAERFGPLWTPVRVQSPKADFEPIPGILTRQAKGQERINEPRALGPSLFSDSLAAMSEGASRTSSGSYRLDFGPRKTDLHLPLALVPGRPGSAYQVTFEGRSGGKVAGAKLGLSAIDGRGWDKAPSGAAAEGLEDARDWKRFSVFFEALPDCPSVQLAWRVLPGPQEIEGFVEVRGVSVTPMLLPRHPAYPLLTAGSSVSRDGRKGWMALFNKSLDQPMSVKLILGGRAASAKIWTVTGPSGDAMNRTKEEVRETVSGAPILVKKGEAVVVLPPCSMSSVEVELAPVKRSAA